MGPNQDLRTCQVLHPHRDNCKDRSEGETRRNQNLRRCFLKSQYLFGNLLSCYNWLCCFYCFGARGPEKKLFLHLAKKNDNKDKLKTRARKHIFVCFPLRRMEVLCSCRPWRLITSRDHGSPDGPTSPWAFKSLREQGGLSLLLK